MHMKMVPAGWQGPCTTFQVESKTSLEGHLHQDRPHAMLAQAVLQHALLQAAPRHQAQKPSAMTHCPHARSNYY